MDGALKADVGTSYGPNHGAPLLHQATPLVGLQLRIINGVVWLITTEVRNKALAQYLSGQRANGIFDLTTAALEVLAYVSFS